MSKDDSIDEYDVELNSEVIEKVSKKLEKTINSILKKDEKENTNSSLELVFVLVSMGCSISHDLGLSEEDVSDFVKTFFQQLNSENDQLAKENKNIKEMN